MNKIKDNSGYVTVLFTVVSIIIVGVISYHIYVSSNVNDIIDLQNSSDISTYTLSSYSARGLNFISANNVAIASSLHIATSIPMLATFLSFGAAAGYGVGYRYQKNIWNKLKPIPKNYMKISVGLSNMNRYIENEWLKLAFAQARSSLKENNKKAKGLFSIDEEYNKEDEKDKQKDMYGFFEKVIVPHSRFKLINKFNNIKDKIDNMKEEISDFMDDDNIRYKGLYHSNAKESICFILKGSKKMIEDERDNMLFWLSGIVPANSLSKVSRSLGKLHGFIKKTTIVDIGYGKCGLNLKVFGKSFNNGIDYEREFGYFVKRKDWEKLGLTVIDNMEEFKKGLRYKGDFWLETKYGIMGRQDGVNRKIVVESIGEVRNRVKDKEAGLFYPEWYPVLKEGVE